MKLLAWLKREPVLAAAWALALISAIFVPPDAAYVDYLDTRTLALLFCLMAVMAALQGAGLFHRAGEWLLRRTGTSRQLEAALIFLCFFASMLVTNDVALITFVPFALEALGMAGLTRRAIPVVTMQTIAANLGSMATPIGNPQNLYLYSRYHLGAGTFFTVTLPYVALSALLLALFVILQKPRPIQAPAFSGGLFYGKARFGVQAALFALCLCAVARVLNVWIAVAAVLVGMLLADRRALLRVDYALLFTFAGFFVFIGNLGRMEAFSDFLRGVLAGREVPVSIAASQVLSNVPAALLLSGFTEDAVSLVIGTNLGGLGTLIASMASLISFKRISLALPEARGHYLAYFTLANLAFLAALCALWWILR